MSDLSIQPTGVQQPKKMSPVKKGALIGAGVAEWAVETAYLYPGAIQYYGPTEVCDLTTRTLALEKA